MSTIFIAYGTSTDTPDLKEVYSDDEFPPDEIYNGIFSFKINAYGDSISGCYLEVIGVSKEIVLDKWERIVNKLPLEEWWS